MPENEKKRLFVDMDGTLARFHDQINYLERMFEENFFLDLDPFENMVKGVRQFMQEHPDVEVFILSAKVVGEPPYCVAEKNLWMDIHLPEIDLSHRIYTEMGRPKAEFISGGISSNDYLVDDYNKGLNQWAFDGGSAIKCHNNINQRGLGAHGGSAGMIWTSSMVHTDDAPDLIAAELSKHMGLSYDLDKLLESRGVHYSEFTAGGSSGPAPFKSGTAFYLEKTLSGISPEPYPTENFNATRHSPNPSLCLTETFKDPLNAIRWLEGNEDFKELQMWDLEGKNLSIPKFLANALSSNLYGCKVDDMEVPYQYAAEAASEFRKELTVSKLPIVGCISYLDAKGLPGETLAFRNINKMKEMIEDSRYCGQPFKEKWFVQPKKVEKAVALNFYGDSERPHSFSISPDNLRIAANICGFTIGSVDKFLSECTSDEVQLIWDNYAKYIDVIGKVMDGFATREEVEQEFYDVMKNSGGVPISAAKEILSRISEWAYWNNSDALESGVQDRADNALKALEQPSEPSKTSLDQIISSARNQQSFQPRGLYQRPPERYK